MRPLGLMQIERSAYTVLRVSSARVKLLERHLERLGEGVRPDLLCFAQNAVDGLYRLTWTQGTLRSQRLSASRLRDGMPVRQRVSPFCSQRGRFPKPGPGSAYEQVRLDGVATLLTDELGLVVFEACSAAVVAFDGTHLVLPRLETPGVASVAEAQVAAHFAVRRAPIALRDGWPLLLINAGGSCAPCFDDRAGFPSHVRALIDAALDL
jgi:hypothetical protein